MLGPQAGSGKQEPTYRELSASSEFGLAEGVFASLGGGVGGEPPYAPPPAREDVRRHLFFFLAFPKTHDSSFVIHQPPDDFRRATLFFPDARNPSMEFFSATGALRIRSYFPGSYLKSGRNTTLMDAKPLCFFSPCQDRKELIPLAHAAALVFSIEEENWILTSTQFFTVNTPPAALIVAAQCPRCTPWNVNVKIDDTSVWYVFRSFHARTYIVDAGTFHSIRDTQFLTSARNLKCGANTRTLWCLSHSLCTLPSYVSRESGGTYNSHSGTIAVLASTQMVLAVALTAGFARVIHETVHDEILTAEARRGSTEQFVVNNYYCCQMPQELRNKSRPTWVLPQHNTNVYTGVYWPEKQRYNSRSQSSRQAASSELIARTVPLRGIQGQRPVRIRAFDISAQTRTVQHQAAVSVRSECSELQMQPPTFNFAQHRFPAHRTIYVRSCYHLTSIKDTERHVYIVNFCKTTFSLDVHPEHFCDLLQFPEARQLNHRVDVESEVQAHAPWLITALAELPVTLDSRSVT
ncbi:hypothetical protein C8R45DRAFT_1068815 [Mycena sanguinolenta]|nr:hypothetical protein C8R45DRAFT_1068815 [Mycena sanguinolenta]